MKQSFSHGRSKTVVVETKRRRVLGPGKTADKSETAAPATAKEATSKKETKPLSPKPAAKKPAAPKSAAAPAADEKKKGAVLRTLSEDEKQARAVALAHARKAQQEKSKREAAEREEREKREAGERAKLEVERERIRAEDEHRAKEACLLYTSPSPRDRQKSRMPSSA